MSLQSIVGDVKSSVGQNIQSFLEQAWSAASGIADQVGTFTANIWSGGFAGVSNFAELKSAITSYSNNVQSLIDEYDSHADLEATFKGQAGEAMNEFITATKSLLDAYARLVEKWNSELDEYYENYTSGDTSLQASVASDTQSVQSAAQNIDLG